jgi:hypothetical protein
VFVEEEQMECRTKDELEQHLSGPANRSIAADVLLRDQPDEEEEDEEERDTCSGCCKIATPAPLGHACLLAGC